jgi:hypothetical protein
MEQIFKINNPDHEIEIIQKKKKKFWIKFLSIRKVKRKKY